MALMACGLASACAAPATAVPAGPLPTATATPFPTLTPVPSPVPGVLVVNAAADLGPISPLVYGTNYGPWAIVPLELKPQALESGVSFLRFPGGAFGDEYDLQPIHIDQFIALCRELGAEPSISVRLKNGTPEQAAALVEYANLRRGYGVRYWSIGNEPSLYASKYRMDYDTARFNREWRAFADAMRAVDPSIQLVGPDIHQFTADSDGNLKDVAGRDWMREFLLANGDAVDVVSIHRYPFPTSATHPATVDDLRRNSREWDRTIPYLRQLIRETTGRDLPVAVTEINSHWSSQTGSEATPDSFYNAIWYADVLGRLIRQRVDMVAHFVFHTRPGRGGWGLLASTEVRPTYYTFVLYRGFGQELLYASSDDADLSIVAARRDDGALTLMVINLGPVERTRTIRLEGFQPAGPAEVRRLDAGHNAELIEPEMVTDGATLRLPAQSATLYTLRP